MVRRWMSGLRTVSITPRVAETSGDRKSVSAAASEQDGPAGFGIRRAAPRDVRALAVLWREMMEFHRTLDAAFEFGPGAQAAIEKHLLETIRSTGGRVYVAEANGRIVGYVLGEIQERKPIYPAGRYGFISDLSVTVESRRKGVGRALVTELLGWFQLHGVTAIELFILETNPVSTAFWESLGFRQYLRLLRRDLTPVQDREKGVA